MRCCSYVFRLRHLHKEYEVYRVGSSVGRTTVLFDYIVVQKTLVKMHVGMK